MSNIVFVPALGNTPARVNRRTGTILLNADTWNNYAEHEQKIILLHELGHYHEQTTDEHKADLYALRNFLLTEKNSLKKALQSFYNTLDMRNAQHRSRYNAVTKTILETDYRLGNNKLNKILKIMYDIELKQLLVDFLKSKGISNIESLSVQQQDAFMNEFFAKTEVKQLIAKKAESEDSEFVGTAIAIGTTAWQAGKAFIKSGAGQKAIGWAADKIGGLFGRKDDAKETAEKQIAQNNTIIGGNPATQTPQQDAAQMQMMQMQMQAQAAQEAEVAKKAEEVRLKAEQEKIAAEKKKKTTLYIGIGAGVAVLIGVVLFIVLRK